MKAMMQRVARSVTAPGIFLGLIAYALWSATQGPHGLREMAIRQAQLSALKGQLAQVQAEEAAWARRVDELGGQVIDADMLDERARAQANMVEPNDIIVQFAADHRTP